MFSSSKFSSLAPMCLATALFAGLLFVVYEQLSFLVYPEQNSTQAKPSMLANTPSTAKTKEYDNIASFNLFGKVGEKPKEEEKEPENLPKTRLKLTLTGVAKGDSENAGSALIQEPNKNTQRYLVGDSIPGNAELYSIHDNHVVLLRNGIKETLEFPRASSSEAQLLARQREKNIVEPVIDSEELSQSSVRSTTSASVQESRKQPWEDSARKQQITERLKNIRKRATMGQ